MTNAENAVINYHFLSTEEEENSVNHLFNRSDYDNYFKRNSRHSYRRSSSTNTHNYSYVGNSNNTIKTTVDDSNYNDKNSDYSNNALAIASHLIEIANRRSPSPPKFLSKTKPDYSVNDNVTSRNNNDYSNGYINNNCTTDINDGYKNLNSTSNNAYNYNNNGSNPYITNQNVVTSKPPPAQNLNRPATNGPLSAPARLDEKEKYFLPFTFPEQFPYKIPPGMATNGSTSPAASPSPRRFSEEGNFRRPLGGCRNIFNVIGQAL